MSDDTASLPTERLVYVGRRAASSGKLAYWYMPLDDRTRLVGGAKPYGSHDIGTVIEVTRPVGEPTQVYVSGEHGPRVIEAWQDEADIAEWRVLDRAEYQVHTSAARVRKGLRDMPDEFDEALRVLARHFAKLNRSQRAALLPLVEARILGGRD